MRINILFLLISLNFFSNKACAQDICNGILSLTGRDNASEARENSIAANTFNHYCKGSTINVATNNSIGIQAIVESIPIKFAVGGGTAEQRLDNFCRVYDSRRAEYSAETIDKSTVVRESLAAFNQCVALAGTEIYFKPLVGKSLITIEVRRGSNDADILGINYDPKKLTCRLPPTSTSGAAIADKDTIRRLDGNFFPITCDRIPMTGSDGVSDYPGTEIVIGTSRGSLLLPLPPHAEMPKQWASEISQHINALENAHTKEVNERNNEIAELKKQLEMQKPIVTNELIEIWQLKGLFASCDFLPGGYGPPLAGAYGPACNEAAVTYCTQKFAGVQSAGFVVGANVDTRVMRVICVRGAR